MAWCRTGNKPLSKPMMAYICWYICHSVLMSWHVQWWHTVYTTKYIQFCISLFSCDHVNNSLYIHIIHFLIFFRVSSPALSQFQWSDLEGYGQNQSSHWNVKFHHFYDIFITGCTESCQNDNFQCSQWWKFCQNEDNFWFSELIINHNKTQQMLGSNMCTKTPRIMNDYANSIMTSWCKTDIIYNSTDHKSELYVPCANPSKYLTDHSETFWLKQVSNCHPHHKKMKTKNTTSTQITKYQTTRVLLQYKDAIAEDQKLYDRRQLRLHWQHGKLLWQFAVPPVATKLAL